MTVGAFDVNNRPAGEERSASMDEMESLEALTRYVILRLERIEAAFTTKQHNTKAYLEVERTLGIMRGREQRYRADVMRMRTDED